MENVVVVGSGCAGLTAAIYCARANLAPLVLEGREPGGQLSTTTSVENFPGFPDGIQGPELIARMHQQAERFGAQFTAGEVTEFHPGQGSHRLLLDDGGPIETRTLIIASGASARWLGLPGERQLFGKGLTACATCDGPFYRGVPVCIIGGGDSACEEALFLTRFASKVYLVHRRDTLRASKIMADRALNDPKIEPIWNSTISGYLTDDAGMIRAVTLQSTKDGSQRELEVVGVFMAIGHTPNTGPFKAHLETDEKGYLVRHSGRGTIIPGVFIAGDVADPSYRQAITAAGDGCAAALDAERYLAGLHG